MNSLTRMDFIESFIKCNFAINLNRVRFQEKFLTIMMFMNIKKRRIEN